MLINIPFARGHFWPSGRVDLSGSASWICFCDFILKAATKHAKQQRWRSQWHSTTISREHDPWCDVISFATICECCSRTTRWRCCHCWRHRLPTLTKRQRDVLTLVSMGDSDKEIGNKLNISETTVRSHTAMIYKRLKVHNRTQASRVAVDIGLLDKA